MHLPTWLPRLRRNRPVPAHRIDPDAVLVRLSPGATGCGCCGRRIEGGEPSPANPASLSGGHDCDPTQAWYWTDDWQAGEAQATAQLADGNGHHYDDLDDMFARLDRDREEP